MLPADADLLIRYLDASLTADETAAIQRRLKAEAAFAQQLFLLSRDATVIAEWAATVEIPQVIPAIAPRVPARYRGRAWATTCGILVASAIAAYFALSTSNRNGSVPSDEGQQVAELPIETKAVEVARLEDLQGEAFLVASDGHSTLLTKGQAIHAGQQVRTGDGGVAVVRLPDATRLELGTDTLLKVLVRAGKALDNPSDFMLVSGMLYADVPSHPEGKSLIFSTPHVTFKADGTRFSSSTHDEVTHVEMEMGTVGIVMDGGNPVAVSAGRSVKTGRMGSLTQKAMPPRVTKFRASLNAGTGPTLGVATAHVGSLLAIHSWDGPVYFVDLDSTSMLPPWMAHERNLRDIALSRDGKLLVTAADEKFAKIKVFEIESQREILAIPKPRAGMNVVDMSSDGKRIVSGGNVVKGVAEVSVWDAGTGMEIASLTGHPQIVTGVAFQPGDNAIATVSKDGQLRLFDGNDYRPLGIHTAHMGQANVLAFSPDGKTLATGGRDGLVHLWDTETWKIRATLTGHVSEVYALAFTTDGKKLASSGGATSIWLWDVESTEPICTYIGHKFKVTGVAFSADGKTLVTSGWDRTIKLWDVAP